MSLILSIPEGRADEIIHREITRAFRTFNLYQIVAEKSPPYCKFPDAVNRDLDLDYGSMEVKSDYAIDQDKTIAVRKIKVYLPITAFEYQGLHPTIPYARPSGGPVFNFPNGQISHIEVKLPGTFDLGLWEEENGTWEGRIDWDDLTLDQSMVAFIRK